MSRWKKFSLFKTVFYMVIMTCFASGILINLSIKPPKDNDSKKKIVIANIFNLFGFSLLLIHHYINTTWREGFIIITIMVLLLLYSTYKSIILYNSS